MRTSNSPGPIPAPGLSPAAYRFVRNRRRPASARGSNRNDGITAHVLGMTGILLNHSPSSRLASSIASASQQTSANPSCTRPPRSPEPLAASLLFRFKAATLGHNPGRNAMCATNRPVSKPSGFTKAGEKSKLFLRAVGNRLDRRKIPVALGSGGGNSRRLHIHGQSPKARAKPPASAPSLPLDPR